MFNSFVVAVVVLWSKQFPIENKLNFIKYI